jgi:hypothetical protein
MRAGVRSALLLSPDSTAGGETITGREKTAIGSSTATPIAQVVKEHDMRHTSVRNLFAIAVLTVTTATLPAFSQSATPAATTTQAAPPAAAPAPPQKGMVWVNTASGVYHLEGSKFYGKTKKGKYMTEADAQKAGYHAAKENGKP